MKSDSRKGYQKMMEMYHGGVGRAGGGSCKNEFDLNLKRKGIYFYIISHENIGYDIYFCPACSSVSIDPSIDRHNRTKRSIEQWKNFDIEGRRIMC